MAEHKLYTSPLELAFAQARAAAARGELPIGAVITDACGNILSQAGNRVEETNDPSAHAEVLALRIAGNLLGSPRLVGCSLYVTLEPCAMCAAAISFARIKKLVFAAWDTKGGGVDHGSKFFSQKTCHHRPDDIIGGINEQQSAQMLKDFFKTKR